MAEQQLAVVSGASSGIGAATARALGEQGWRVVLIARSEDKLADVARQVEAAGGAAVVRALDAAEGEAVVGMADAVKAEHGTPELIVNSAGAGQWKFIEETPPQEAATMMGAPYFAAYNVTHAFMADMIAAGRGVIVHVGSPASLVTWPGATGYTAARWALRGLHEALHQDLRGTGVSSCHVVFGKVSSDYFANNPDSEEHIPGVAGMIRTVTPEECARVILNVARRPRRQVLYPTMLRMFNWTSHLAPPLVRWLAGRTGRRH